MPMPRKISRYGWHPGLPDHRALKFADHFTVKMTLPEVVDLRPQCPVIYDQGMLGSCTANAANASVQFMMMKQKGRHFIPSRLFTYYETRKLEGTADTDSGASLTDTVKVLREIGVPPESEWWYNVSAFTAPPPRKVVADAAKLKVDRYLQLRNWNILELKSCLADGNPFVFGFTVYESFESPEVAKTGMVPFPDRGEDQLGGHAVLAVGYDDKKGMFIVRNSWGTDWGLKGYFYMPYAYVTNPDLADDFWTITHVANKYAA